MEESRKTGPKDVFLQIFTIITLYVSLVSLAALVFQLINIYFPDPLDFWRQGRGALRWPLAVLTVVFPLYLWTNTFLQREVVKYPEKRELKTRKWLLYLTLFMASGVIAGDLIALIFRYLEGELSIRFFLKVLAAFLIAGSVFLYYGWSIKKEIPATKDKKMNIFVKSAAGLTLVLIVFAYFTAGSPQEERLRRFDERRVSDLQQIQSQIVEFWRAKEKLPGSLQELRDEIRGFAPPQDPETGRGYGYEIIDQLSFKLCANFNRPSHEDISRAPVNFIYPPPENWQHSVGQVCFSRTIDPQFYPSYQKEQPVPR